MMKALKSFVRFLRAEEEPWITFVFWFLFGNCILIFFFRDISNIVFYPLFEGEDHADYLHNNFIDSVIAIYLIVSAASSILGGWKAMEGTNGKLFSVLTILSIIPLLILLAKVAGTEGLEMAIPPATYSTTPGGVQ